MPIYKSINENLQPRIVFITLNSVKIFNICIKIFLEGSGPHPQIYLFPRQTKKFLIIATNKVQLQIMSEIHLSDA